MTSKNNQNGSNLLVTTPLDGTWGENEDIVFLGEWCKEYFKKTEWTAREHVVIPYHWKNQKKFGEDYDYLNNLYEYMLSEVSLRLNSIHKVNYSLQYWRIIVGPWLLTYIPAIWDRWENIILLSDLNMKLKTVIPRSSKFRVVPCDYNAAVNLVSNSNEWNYLIYCDILKVQNISTIELIKKNVFFKTRVPNVNKKIKSLTQVFAELFDLVARKIWISDSYNILIYNGYFSIINLIKLNIKLKQIPRLFFEFDEIAKCGEPDLFMRSGLGRDLHSKHSKHSKHFESFLLSNIFVDMPVSYLEGYKDIFSQCKNLPSAKVIMTAGSTFDNELFKSWTAKQVENGSKLIIGEHGGSIPEKRSGVFNHEEDSCYKKTVWHSLLFNPKHVSMPHNKKIREICNLNGKKVTLIGFELPRYSCRAHEGPRSSLVMEDFEQKIEFIKLLEEEVVTSFKVRPYPTEWWSTGSRYADIYGNAVLSSNKKLFQDFSQSKIIICSYPQTTFSEAMHSGVPTVLLYLEEYWDLHPYYNELIKELRCANIVHSDPVSAANHINSVQKDPFKWWNNSNTVKARKMFYDDCGKNVKDSTTDWSIFFKRLLTE